MKKTNKILIMLLIAAMIFSFASGCSSKKDAEPDEKDTEASYTIDNIREYVVGVDEPVELVNGSKQPLINFDNAATTPALKPVMDAVDEELKMYGSIGRGFSQKSNRPDVLDGVS